ncbi:MAG: hypothetical protein HGA95_00140 [Caldiserica bacterium]|nr:hypothetical protein [Caldisericota bacterium]
MTTNKFSFKTPHLLRGFVVYAMIATLGLMLTGCGNNDVSQKTISKPRYEFSYNEKLFNVKENVTDDYQIKIDSLGDDFDATLTVFAPTKIDEKVKFEDYYDTAKLDFLASFEKVLNQKDSKIELKGITTFVDVITATKEKSADNWTGMLKLSITKDGLLILTVKCNSAKIELYRNDINNMFESVKLKGIDD